MASEAKGRVWEVRKMETLSTGTVVPWDLNRHWWTQDRLSSTNSIRITSCLASHQRPPFPWKGHLGYNVNKSNEIRCNFDVKVGRGPGGWEGGTEMWKGPRAPLSQKKTCQQKPTQYNVRECAGSLERFYWFWRWKKEPWIKECRMLLETGVSVSGTPKGTRLCWHFKCSQA